MCAAEADGRPRPDLQSGDREVFMELLIARAKAILLTLVSEWPRD
jgi:hypothetical protein